MEYKTDRTKILGDENLMPFGAHKDKKMKEVPLTYLDWLHGQKWIKDWPNVLGYIQTCEKEIEKEFGRG